MLASVTPVWQVILGTLFTWGMTAAGAGLVFFCPRAHRKFLDGSLGFAAGVMVAASFWSLLMPAIDMAKDSGSYGAHGEWAFFPAAVGFALGAAFVYGADQLLTWLGLTGSADSLMLAVALDKAPEYGAAPPQLDGLSVASHDSADDSAVRRRQAHTHTVPLQLSASSEAAALTNDKQSAAAAAQQWRRILLLIVAITVHNIPEGLAVGVGFGAAALPKSSADGGQRLFASARSLAIGIGLQNFPEGLAVSLPLRAAGVPALRAFWWGQLSGLVEPVAGLLGYLAVSVVEALLPYALAFAAGAMIFVVVDDIIPESHSSGNGQLASLSCVVGFLIMMVLDVGLGT